MPKTPIYVDVPDPYDDSGLQQRIAAIESRVTALESVPEPPPEPEPPVPPPDSDNEHWKKVSTDSRAVFADSYDDPETYKNLVATGSHNYTDDNGWVFHDPVKQAARFHIPKGEMSLRGSYQFKPRFEPVTDDIVSVQWEAFYDPETTSHGGKAFNTLNLIPRISLEIQTHIIGEIGDYKLLHSIRCYHSGQIGGNGYAEQLSVGELASRSVQVGPGLDAPVRQIKQNPSAYPDVRDGGLVCYVYPGEWVRYTMSWDLSESPARLKLWINDTLVLSDPDDHNLGFICDPGPGSYRGWSGVIAPEFNNSSTVAPVDVDQWVRRCVVWKGAEIPR